MFQGNQAFGDQQRNIVSLDDKPPKSSPTFTKARKVHASPTPSFTGRTYDVEAKDADLCHTQQVEQAQRFSLRARPLRSAQSGGKMVCYEFKELVFREIFGETDPLIILGFHLDNFSPLDHP